MKAEVAGEEREASRPGASGGDGARSPGMALAGGLLAYLVFRFLLASVRLPEATPAWVLAAAAAVSCAGSIGLPILVIASLVRQVRSVLPALGLLVAGLGVWYLLGGPARGILPGALRGTLQDSGMILAASAAGLALAAALREPNILLPAGAFAAFADFVVVNFGTVKHALSTPKGQALVQSVSAKVPAVHPALPTLTIGPADFLFLGIFLACAARFEMGLARNAWALSAVLAVSLLAVLLFGINMPALAPMALTFVALNWRKFRLTRDEILGTVIVLLLAGGLFFGYFALLYGKRG